MINLGTGDEPDLVALVAGPVLDGNRRWRVVSKDERQLKDEGLL